VFRVVTIALALACLAGASPARAAGCNGFLAGINGILTAPADIVYSAIEPPGMFEEFPAAPVSSHFLGTVAGVFYTVDRIGWGVVDVVMTPLWVFPTLSPKPVFEIIPFYEIEYDAGARVVDV